MFDVDEKKLAPPAGAKQTGDTKSREAPQKVHPSSVAPQQARSAADHSAALAGSVAAITGDAGDVRGDSPTQGSTNPYPHFEMIQQAFGSYDISGVKTMPEMPTAGRAATVGDTVAIAPSASSRTAAHEAAHVVQQRAGKTPEGGVSRPGDALERHADLVADAVTSGASAEPLLGQLGAGVEGPQGAMTSALQYEGGAPAAQDQQKKPSGTTVITLHGFRGVREIRGEKVDALKTKLAGLSDGPEKEELQKKLDFVDTMTKQYKLLWAGHIGVSVDGGKTIYGFTPKFPEGMSAAEGVGQLKQQVAFPGVVGNDTAIFSLANKMASQHGWNTNVVVNSQQVTTQQKAETTERLMKMSGMDPGEHGLWYSFPKKPQDQRPGEAPFAASGGVAPENIANCAMFPQHVGVQVPEQTGNLVNYMNAMEERAKQEQAAQ